MKYLLLITAVLITFISTAQQQAQYSMYRFNPLVFNPAYAGSRDALSVTAIGRKQWVGLDGSPTTGAISIHTPLKNEKVNFGFSLASDKIGSTKNNSVYGDITYRTKINDKTRISFGLKAGVDIFSIDYSNLDVIDREDIIYQTPIANSLSPNFGVGIYVDNEKWFIGLAAPRILEEQLRNEMVLINGYKETSHAYLMGGYSFKINPFIDIIPIVNVKYVQNAPISVDLNVNSVFFDKVWLGLGYRINDALIANLMYTFNENMRIGYAYDMNVSELSSYNNGSHEIMLNYDFITRTEGIRTPRKF